MHEETKLVKNVRLPRAKWHKLCYSEILDLEEINKNKKNGRLLVYLWFNCRVFFLHQSNFQYYSYVIWEQLLFRRHC